MKIVFVVALEHTVLILKHVLIAPLEGTPRNHRMAALVQSRAALARPAPIFWTKELRIFPPAHRALMAPSLLKVHQSAVASAQRVDMPMATTLVAAALHVSRAKFRPRQTRVLVRLVKPVELLQQM